MIEIVLRSAFHRIFLAASLTIALSATVAQSQISLGQQYSSPTTKAIASPILRHD
jgi:hypothetical protein